MARLSALVDATARATGWPQNNVGLYARHAREAGLIRQASRGVAGAEMTSADAAALLCAMLGSHFAKDAAETIRALQDTESVVANWELDFAPNFDDGTLVIAEEGARTYAVSELEWEPITAHIHKELSFLLTRHSLFGALERLIESARVGYLDKFTSLESDLGRPGFIIGVREQSKSAWINMISWRETPPDALGYSYTRFLVERAGVMMMYEPRQKTFVSSDLGTTRTITHGTLLEVGRAIR